MPNATAPIYATFDDDPPYPGTDAAIADIKPSAATKAAVFDDLIADISAQGLLDYVADELILGRSMHAIAIDKGVRPRDLKAWINADQDRYNVISSAMELYADSLVSKTIEIADGSGDNVARDRLRVDARWRLAEKLDKVRFGNSDSRLTGNITIVLANPLDVGMIFDNASNVPVDGNLISLANSVPNSGDAGGGLPDPTPVRVP